MINDVVDYIRREVSQSLSVDDADVVAGNANMLKDTTKQGIYISLVNLEEERTLKNVSHTMRKNNRTHYQEPPVNLNLFLLFSFTFPQYSTCLLRLSETIELFQNKSVFNANNDLAANTFPPRLEKLVFDMYSIDFEKLNHLWGVLGGTYYPSVLYKVRMVAIRKDESSEGPEITTVKVTTGLS